MESEFLELCAEQGITVVEGTIEECAEFFKGEGYFSPEQIDESFRLLTVCFLPAEK